MMFWCQRQNLLEMFYRSRWMENRFSIFALTTVYFCCVILSVECVLSALSLMLFISIIQELTNVWLSKSSPDLLVSHHMTVGMVQYNAAVLVLTESLSHSHFFLKQNRRPTLRTAWPMMIPQRILLPAPAPFTPHQTTEQQRRSGHITPDTHTHHRPYDESAPTRLILAQCVHTDEWRVGINMHTHNHLGKIICIVRWRVLYGHLFITIVLGHLSSCEC